MDDPQPVEAVAVTPNGAGRAVPLSPFVIAVRTLEVTGRLHEWLSLAGALVLFLWLVVDPHVLRLLGALGFSLFALAMRYMRTHGGP